MPNNIHRAPSQPIHGAQMARLLGTVSGAAVGGLAGADEVATSPGAVAWLPKAVANTAVVALQKTAGLTQPLRAACKGVAGAVTRTAPALGYAVYWPSKASDVAVAGYGRLCEQVAWANERTLATRLPYAAYPAACEWESPAPGCPDPLGYVRTAQLAPYLYAVAAVATGCLVGRVVLPAVWSASVPLLVHVPENGIGYLPATYQGAVVALGHHARRAQREAHQARAAAQAAAEASASDADVAAGATEDVQPLEVVVQAQAPAAATETTPLL